MMSGWEGLAQEHGMGFFHRGDAGWGENPLVLAL